MLLQFSVLVANGFTIEHLEGAKFHYVQFDHNIPMPLKERIS